MIRPHYNRSLVLNHNSKQGFGSTDVKVGVGSISGSAVGNHSIINSGWVSKRDRHLQIVNASIFEARANPLSTAVKTSGRQTLQENRNTKQLENASDPIDLKTNKSLPPRPGILNEILVNGIRFRVVSGGRKLLRVLSE